MQSARLSSVGFTLRGSLAAALSCLDFLREKTGRRDASLARLDDAFNPRSEINCRKKRISFK
jgi:hypothetical protein